MTVGVEMRFRVPTKGEPEPQEHHVKVEASSVTPEDVAAGWQGGEPPKPPAGSYTYSGRHDHGILLPPQGNDSSVAHLIAAVQKAKAASNEYLTHIIEEEKVRSTSSQTATEPLSKRTKVDTQDT